MVIIIIIIVAADFIHIKHIYTISFLFLFSM